MRQIFALAVVVVGTATCARQPSLQAKHEPLYRAAKSVEGAIAVGVTYQTFGELLQSLATEVLIAGDRANSDEEKALVAAYAELLTNYKDSSTIWKHQIESSKYEWAKDQIVVGDELVPVAAKYKLPVTELTAYGAKWKALPADSTQRVWVVAGEQATKATRLYYGTPAPLPSAPTKG
jgi:hypothetical protein